MEATASTQKIRYIANAVNFSKIPGSPVAYWVSEKVMMCYKNVKIGDVANPCKGIDTGDNDRFLRMWYEVENRDRYTPTGNPVTNIEFKTYRWYPYNKGGNYRKWYGNNEYLLDWKENGGILSNFKGSNLRNRNRYFSQGITWSTVTSGLSSFRYFDYGFLFDNGGSCLFSTENLLYIEGLLNSIVVKKLLEIQPTLNNQPGTIGGIPFILKNKAMIECLVKSNIDFSRKDWDSFETSWDFKKHPLI